ncbi:MAG: gliding motility-associated C-terminal domain-containing protein, partial [Bacteroidota bacterium]
MKQTKVFRYISFRFIVLLLSISLFSVVDLSATHNRAGEITFEQIGSLKYRVTVTTYTKTSSVPADRDSLEVFWGDGTSEFVVRSNGNGNGQPLANDIKFNQYIAEHDYPGRGTYMISMTDPNRNGGILNVNAPNSDQVPFYIETELTILDPNFQGTNNSPQLLAPPIDIGFVNQPFLHNPNAFDIEGDSLAYELIVPKQGPGTPVTNYSFPDAIGTPIHFIQLDPLTGDFEWLEPRVAGEYNIAILIKEYRGGQLISSITRDMQITIEPQQNRPPIIAPIEDICVVAGDTVDLQVIANDLDMGQEVLLSVTGGPLAIATNPAIFTAPANYSPPLVFGNFFWATTCDHIRSQFYQVVFKAEDNFFGTQGASTLKTVRIRVVAPPPQDPQATALSGEVDVSWENPYDCESTSNFLGFSVWRREGSNPFTPDTCETGLAGRGYTQLVDRYTGTDPGGSGRYFYKDTNVERAKFYCYRILAEFAVLNPANLPINFVESLPSDEVCVQLNRDVPLVTHVSVESTSTTNGEIYVEWSKPIAEDLDTIQNPGPYTYILYRSPDFTGGNFTQVTSFTSPTFEALNDTMYTDTGLNTQDNPYSYQVELLVNGGTSIGFSNTSSSIFLSITSSDRINALTWQEEVTWENLTYTVYRFNTITNQFDSIAITTEPQYDDTDVENDQEYCYEIRSTGTYNIPGIVDPLINFSQEACGTPIDTVPPCPPILTVTNDCDDENPVDVTVQNNLSWTNPNISCPLTSDTREYNIYYAPSPDAPFTLIENIQGAFNTDYVHQLLETVAGCYYVTAVDSLGNESLPSNIICKENCPNYRLPNVFTPNNDG